MKGLPHAGRFCRRRRFYRQKSLLLQLPQKLNKISILFGAAAAAKKRFLSPRSKTRLPKNIRRKFLINFLES